MTPTEEAKIEVTLDEGKMSIKAFMPVWERKSSSNDGQTYIQIPLLGLETYGRGEKDIDMAIREAIAAFCVVAIRHGKGIDKELQLLGWEATSRRVMKHRIIMKVAPKAPIFSGVLETGSKRAFNFQQAV